MRGARGHRKDRRRESKEQPDDARTDGGKRGERGRRIKRVRRRGRGSSGGGGGWRQWAQLSLCILPRPLVLDPTLCSWPPRLLPFGPCPQLLASRRWPARQVRRSRAARRIAPSTGPEPDVGDSDGHQRSLHSPLPPLALITCSWLTPTRSPPRPTGSLQRIQETDPRHTTQPLTGRRRPRTPGCAVGDGTWRGQRAEGALTEQELPRGDNALWGTATTALTLWSTWLRSGGNWFSFRAATSGEAEKKQREGNRQRLTVDVGRLYERVSGEEASFGCQMSGYALVCTQQPIGVGWTTVTPTLLWLSVKGQKIYPPLLSLHGVQAPSGRRLPKTQQGPARAIDSTPPCNATLGHPVCLVWIEGRLLPVAPPDSDKRWDPHLQAHSLSLNGG